MPEAPPKVNLSDIDGLTDTQESVPTYVPPKFSSQYQIVTSGGSSQLYVYDAANALWLSLLTDLQSPISVPEGGTGATTFTSHGVILGEGTSALGVTGAGTAGQVLTSNGASADPTYQTPVPGWVDEGSVSWAAETTNKTLTPTNTGKDIYMVIFKIDFTVGAAGNAFDMQLSGDTGNNYGYETDSGAATFSVTQPSTFIRIGTAGSNSAIKFSGVIYIQGTGEATANAVLGVSASINPAFVSAGGGSSPVLIRGQNGNVSSLTSITFIVNGKTVTGKAHLYSLNI